MGDIISIEREIRDILTNLGLGANKVHDDNRINGARIDTNSHN